MICIFPLCSLISISARACGSCVCKRVASRVQNEIGNVSLSLSLYRNRRPRDPCSGKLASSRGRSPGPGGCATCMTKYLHGPYVLYSLCPLHSASTRAQVLTLTAFGSPPYICCLPPLSKSGGSAVNFWLLSSSDLHPQMVLLIPICCAAQLSAEVSGDRDRTTLLSQVLTLVSL